MNIIKRAAAAAAAFVTAFCTVGCGGAERFYKSDKLSVVCTIFPGYDWVREIMGDTASQADITWLTDNGADLHSYQPTAEDIVKISTCDLLICVGGESDEWVLDALKESPKSDVRVIDMIDMLGENAKTEEIKEGMQAERHEHGEEEEEYDEHVWLSLKNAEVLCGQIARELSELDPDNAAAYEENLAAYTEKLDSLDDEFAEMIDGAKEKTLIFADRFPFRYLADDYGLDYYAAFAGCAADSEASFETVTFLAAKIDELGADTVYTIENSDGRIAQSVIRITDSHDQKTAVLDSLQSVSGERAGSGETYLSIMRDNYNIIKEDIS